MILDIEKRALYESRKVLPSDLIAIINQVQALTLTAGGGSNLNLPLADNVPILKNNTDTTKLISFDLSGLSTATTRTWTFPNISGTFARSDAAQTLIGIQTFSSIPVFSAGLGSPVMTTQSQGDNSTKGATTEYVDRLSLTIGTGLTNISGTLSSDLSTGKAGGQSAIGGTAAGNNLTLSSTSNVTKGNIIFGASSYSEANNTQAMVLSNPGSTIVSTWTGTASGQSVISESGSITTRSLAAGGTADSYAWRIINPTYIMGTSSNSQILHGLEILGTFPTNSSIAASLFINSTHNGAATGSYLIQAQSAGTDRFRVFNNGNITSNGVVGDLTFTTSLALRTASTIFSGSGTNVDVGVFNTAGSGLNYRFRSTNAGVLTLNDGTRDYITLSGGATTWQGNFTLGTAGNKFLITEGTNGSVGQTTLVSGTKAITISGVTTTTRAFVQLVTPTGTTLTTTYQVVCTSNTITIQANIAAGTINTADGSTLNYLIFN